MLSLGLTALGGFVAYGEGSPAVYYHAGCIDIMCPAEAGLLQLVDNSMTAFDPTGQPAGDFGTHNLACYFKWMMTRRENALVKVAFAIGDMKNNSYSLRVIPNVNGNTTFAQYNNGRNAGQAALRYNLIGKWCYAQKRRTDDTLLLYTDTDSTEVSATRHQATAIDTFANFTMNALAEVDYTFAIAWTRAATTTFARHIMPLSDAPAAYSALMCPESQTIKEI